MKIDNFALTMFQACPIKYKLRLIDGWTTRRKSGALGFGGALHEGLAAWYQTGDKLKALQAIDTGWPENLPAEDYRTKEKCLQVMLEYIKTYPVETFTVVGAPDSPMVECTFTLFTGMYLDCAACDTKWPGRVYVGAENKVLVDGPSTCPNCNTDLEPIEYGGIFDTLVEFSRAVYVLEHKTTSQLGAYYFNQFKPNNQVTGYCWAASELSGQRVGGAIINAVGVFKASATKFERQITNRSPAEICEWLINVKNTCEMIKSCERRGFFPMFTPSCQMYGACEYHSVHVLSNETERQKRLEQDYVREPWVFEERGGVK